MIDKNDLILPLALLNKALETLIEARTPADLQETYPFVLDMLEMAISEIERRCDGSGAAAL